MFNEKRVLLEGNWLDGLLQLFQDILVGLEPWGFLWDLFEHDLMILHFPSDKYYHLAYWELGNAKAFAKNIPRAFQSGLDKLSDLIDTVVAPCVEVMYT